MALPLGIKTPGMIKGREQIFITPFRRYWREILLWMSQVVNYIPTTLFKDRIAVVKDFL